MADYFFDTSALVKAYVAETGTDWVRTILDDPQHRIWVCALTEVELNAALARRFRAGDLTQQQVDLAVADAHQDFGGFYIVEIFDDIVKRAVNLAQRHGLRAYDAVQLSTAIEVRSIVATAEPRDLFYIVSADLELNAAAQVEGIPVEDPSIH